MAALRTERESRRLSVRQLAAQVSMSPTYLSRIERGERSLSADIADRLEAALEAAPVFVDVN
jgi:transcriptional regulator with XRE-family HTH domain